MSKAKKSNIGQEVNEKWDIHAHHALYRRNGTWYYRLKKFPRALLDGNGYVLFKTEVEYLSCPYLNLGKQTTCRKGISSIPEYVRIENDLGQAVDLDNAEGPERTLCVTNRVIRDTPLARKVKALHQNRCQVCGLTLVLLNDKSYSEAHPIKPLGSTHPGPDIMGNIVPGAADLGVGPSRAAFVVCAAF